MKTIIVTENPTFWKKILSKVPDIEFETPNSYLTNFENKSKSKQKIINLCSKYTYQSTGYYVSLLGQARKDKVIPSVITIQDFNTNTSKHLIETEYHAEIQKTLKNLTTDTFELSIYFGRNLAKHYDQICKKLYNLIPMPLFRIYFKRNKKASWYITKIDTLNINDIPKQHHDFLKETAQKSFLNLKVSNHIKKRFSCSVAMLVNPNETHAPSNKIALQKFIKAGEKLGIDVVPIQKEGIKTLPEYDGLFIRETTAVNHHTYQFSRRALAEDLIVIDDPTSILRCSNKVYLADMLNNSNLKAPKTTVIFKNNWKEVINNLTYPIILKQPDSAFSLGVLKAKNLEDCENALIKLFKDSELVIAQEYMPSPYDWRIGILDNEVLFACRYYMAKDHWQIYNWASNAECEGDFDTVPISAVPEKIITAAKKACKLIGDGLYGVDIKFIDDTPYIIEINDNPNIDHKIEDIVLGDELYLKIMNTFLTRIRRKFYDK